MKQRFRAREGWLLAPFLLIGAAALFYWRWERVNSPGKRGFYVSKIERTPAKSREEENGISHYVTVTLSHGWPRPRWWGERQIKEYWLDPLAPEKPPILSSQAKSDLMIAAGGTLTAVGAGKVERFNGNYQSFPGYTSFDGENYIVRHPLTLRGVPAKLGQVKFEGVYQMTGTPQREVDFVARAPGEKFAPIDKDPGARIVSIKTTLWEKQHQIGMNNVPETMDTIFVIVVVEHLAPPAPGAPKHEVTTAAIADVNDEARTNFGYSVAGALPEDEPKVTLKPGQSARLFNIWLDERDATRGSITVKGEVSADDRWPIPFATKLPPRPAPKK